MAKQSKPDNRSNNVERLHDMIENTQKKMRDAEISLEFASPEEKQRLQRKMSVENNLLLP